MFVSIFKRAENIQTRKLVHICIRSGYLRHERSMLAKIIERTESSVMKHPSGNKIQTGKVEQV